MFYVITIIGIAVAIILGIFFALKVEKSNCDD